jgi:hypothetical protein
VPLCAGVADGAVAQARLVHPKAFCRAMRRFSLSWRATTDDDEHYIYAIAL